MSDPRMAAAMEADMRRRFWISLALTIPGPVLATGHQPVGADAAHAVRGAARLADAGLLHTCGAVGQQRVPHRRLLLAEEPVLNMSVLVSLGILVAYLFSVGLTFLAPGQETFYEAAAMLAMFLLFGHWMEMKARRGSSDSVRKLLDLAPQTATIERDGRQVELPVADVV